MIETSAPVPSAPPCNPISERTRNQIDLAFVYHAPQGDQPARYVYLRNRAKELAEDMAHHSKDSRELSLALTKLEEAVFWCNAGIARNG